MLHTGANRFLDHAGAVRRQRPNARPVGEALVVAVDHVGYGAVVLDQDGRVLHANAAACRLLEQAASREVGLSEEEWLSQAMWRLLGPAAPWFPRNAEAWITLPRDNDRPLALYCIPLSGEDENAEAMAIILADFSVTPQPRSATLTRIFGLTATEARLAIQIGQGDTLSDIALAHRVSVATVRSQLSSIFAKTRTRRQAELAMLMARVAILP